MLVMGLEVGDVQAPISAFMPDFSFPLFTLDPGWLFIFFFVNPGSGKKSKKKSNLGPNAGRSQRLTA